MHAHIQLSLATVLRTLTRSPHRYPAAWMCAVADEYLILLGRCQPVGVFRERAKDVRWQGCEEQSFKRRWYNAVWCHHHWSIRRVHAADRQDWKGNTFRNTAATEISSALKTPASKLFVRGPKLMRKTWQNLLKVNVLPPQTWFFTKHNASQLKFQPAKIKS